MSNNTTEIAVSANRCFVGTDIERWRNLHELDESSAAFALGLKNYKRAVLQIKPVSYTVELLMRLYNEKPGFGMWPKHQITMHDLFRSLYTNNCGIFAGTEHEVTARVDCQARLGKLFGRSTSRTYRWLYETKHIGAMFLGAHGVSTRLILSKLSQFEDHGETLDRLSKLTYQLRGEMIDITTPVPTADCPPQRKTRGRKRKVKQHA